MELHIANPKKYMSLKFYTQKKYLESKFSTPKNTRPNISILIYSIRQTLRPKKKYVTSLDPEQYQERKFSTPKKPPGVIVIFSQFSTSVVCVWRGWGELGNIS